MKEPFSIDTYFDLKDFDHREWLRLFEFPWQILSEIEKYIRSQRLGIIEGVVSPSAYLVHPELISIGKGTIVEPGAYIQGPCIIGKNCTVRHGAYIRGNFLCGDHCIVGHDTEIKNVIFLTDVRAGHFAYIGDSILGNLVNLGAGTICANLKFNHSPIDIHHNGEKIETNLKKFGAILGDGVQTGCNSVLNPGSLVGKETFIYPCLNVGGVIPANSVVKPSTSVRIIPKSSK